MASKCIHKYKNEGLAYKDKKDFIIVSCTECLKRWLCNTWRGQILQAVVLEDGDLEEAKNGLS